MDVLGGTIKPRVVHVDIIITEIHAIIRLAVGEQEFLTPFASVGLRTNG